MEDKWKRFLWPYFYMEIGKISQNGNVEACPKEFVGKQ